MNHPLDGGRRRFGGARRPEDGERGEGTDVSADERFGWGADPPARRGYGRGIYGESGLGDTPGELGGQASERDRLPEDYAPGLSTFGARGGFAGRGPKGYTRSDERIREEVCERLSRDDALDASEIEVRVEGGQVTLAGRSPTRRDRQRAENIAADVAGVADVHNLIRVDRGP